MTRNYETYQLPKGMCEEAKQKIKEKFTKYLEIDQKIAELKDVKEKINSDIAELIGNPVGKVIREDNMRFPADGILVRNVEVKYVYNDDGTKVTLFLRACGYRLYKNGKTTSYADYSYDIKNKESLVDVSEAVLKFFKK